MPRDYRKIRAWQMADELAVNVYKATAGFPRSEVYGLTSQIRRAAVSVPANIVEGAYRNHQKEYLQFLYTAIGSLAELGYHLSFSSRIDFLDQASYSDLNNQHGNAIKTLRALINYIESPKSSV